MKNKKLAKSKALTIDLCVRAVHVSLARYTGTGSGTNADHLRPGPGRGPGPPAPGTISHRVREPSLKLFERKNSKKKKEK